MTVMNATKFGNGAAVALSKQILLKEEMEIIAQNFAKMNVTGATSDRLVFSEHVFRSPNNQEISFVKPVGLLRNLAPGILETTGNTFHLAINGRGYFAVQAPTGTQYTRSGNFRLNPRGELICSKGYPVLNKDQAPILIPAGSQPIQITPDGRIIGARGMIAQLSITSFDNEQSMVSRGESLYETTQTPLPARNVTVEQGVLEGSNTEPIQEMVRMMANLRAYQQIQEGIKNTDDRTKKTIQDIIKLA